jgi:hypothetical protein
MVILSDERAFLSTEYHLVRVHDRQVLMTRQLRACDAETYNRQWEERGIPARWERACLAAATA